MAVTKRVVVFYEVPEGRNVIAYLQLVIEEDGRELARSKPHAVNFPPDCDASAWLEENNRYLQNHPDFQWPEIPAEIVENTLRLVASQHTPAVRAAYATWLEQHGATAGQLVGTKT